MKTLKSILLISLASAFLAVAAGCGSKDDAATTAAPGPKPSNDAALQKGEGKPLTPNTN